MASEPFKSTLQQQQANRAVRAAMNTHRQQIVEGAQELYQIVVREGETMIDWKMFQEFNLRLMEIAYDQLVAADLTQRVETAETTAVREILSVQANEVRRRISRFKSDFIWSYGQGSLGPFGLNGAFSRKPLTLLAEGRYVVVKLRDLSVALPDPISEERALDRESIADELEPDLDQLDEALKEVEHERKETQEARATRKLALKYFRRRHVNLTRVLEGYLRLIGLDDLADRLRLVVARRPVKATDGGEDAADSGSPADSAADADATAAESTEPASEPVTESP